MRMNKRLPGFLAWTKGYCGWNRSQILAIALYLLLSILPSLLAKKSYLNLTSFSPVLRMENIIIKGECFSIKKRKRNYCPSLIRHLNNGSFLYHILRYFQLVRHNAVPKINCKCTGLMEHSEIPRAFTFLSRKEVVIEHGTETLYRENWQIIADPKN